MKVALSLTSTPGFAPVSNHMPAPSTDVLVGFLAVLQSMEQARRADLQMAEGLAERQEARHQAQASAFAERQEERHQAQLASMAASQLATPPQSVGRYVVGVALMHIVPEFTDTNPTSSSSSCVRRRRAGTRIASGRHLPTAGSADLGPPTPVWPSVCRCRSLDSALCGDPPAERKWPLIPATPARAPANARTPGRP